MGTSAALAVMVVMGLLFTGLLYALILRSREWNYPTAARGIGIGLLGLAMMAVGAMAKDGGAGSWAGLGRGLGAAVAGGGLLYMMYGFAKDR